MIARFALAFVVLMTSSLTASHADPAASAPPNAAMTARDAGVRYGQALGALEICHGSMITPAAKALGDRYTGPDLEVFKAQAAKVYDAWHKVKNCSNALDPNACKIIMDKSCAVAEDEIGANGTVAPGLVDFMKH